MDHEKISWKIEEFAADEQGTKSMGKVMIGATI